VRRRETITTPRLGCSYVHAMVICKLSEMRALTRPRIPRMRLLPRNGPQQESTSEINLAQDYMPDQPVRDRVRLFVLEALAALPLNPFRSGAPDTRSTAPCSFARFLLPRVAKRPPMFPWRSLACARRHRAAENTLESVGSVPSLHTCYVLQTLPLRTHAQARSNVGSQVKLLQHSVEGKRKAHKKRTSTCQYR